jgi:hypothetical protein
MKFSLFKNISIILALIVVVYVVANYYGIAASSVMDLLHIPGSSVQGASTYRAQEISGDIGNDVGGQVENARSYILDVKVADAMHAVMRLQQVPKDVQNITTYTREKVEGVVQSREQKAQKEKHKHE